MRTLTQIRAHVLLYRIGREELTEAAGLNPQTVRRALDGGKCLAGTIEALDQGVEKILEERRKAAWKIMQPGG